MKILSINDGLKICIIGHIKEIKITGFVLDTQMNWIDVNVGLKKEMMNMFDEGDLVQVKGKIIKDNSISLKQMIKLDFKFSLDNYNKVI